jgi:hypothetical protein
LIDEEADGEVMYQLLDVAKLYLVPEFGGAQEIHIEVEMAESILAQIYVTRRWKC